MNHITCRDERSGQRKFPFPIPAARHCAHGTLNDGYRNSSCFTFQDLSRGSLCIMNTCIDFLDDMTSEEAEHLPFELRAACYAQMAPPDLPRHEPDVQNQPAATTALDQSNEVPRFPYEPLGSNEFRLLHLTGLVNGQISGELIKANFPSTCIFSRTKPLEYTCISYIWGPPSTASSSSRVLINAYPFSVSPNLMSFLTCYVVEKLVIIDDAADDMYLWVDYKSMDTYLWIDQICINQLDFPEKDAASRTDERDLPQREKRNCFVARRPQSGIVSG
jgi:hypothetical protein